MSRRFFRYLSVFTCVFLGNYVSAETRITQANSTILGDTTWTVEGSPYILTRDVEVRSQATLTIQPGVEVRFEPTDEVSAGEDSDGVEFIVQGRLNAVGTENQPIRFHGQNLQGSLEHATGIRFEVDAQNSQLHYLEIEGLAYGIDIRADIGVDIQNVEVDVSKIALRRTVGSSDIQLIDTDLKGAEAAIDVVAMSDTRLFLYQGGEIDGNFVIHGSQRFNTQVQLNQILITGDIILEGNLQAGSLILLDGSILQEGMISVVGDVNTSAAIRVRDSIISNLTTPYALNVSGVVLADAEIEISNSLIEGNIELGPDVTLDGEFEGQYILVNTPSTWSEASASCAAMGAHLADVRNAEEAENLYHIAQRNPNGVTWIGGRLITPPCVEGDQYVDVGDDCALWDSLGYSVQTVTEGKDCICGNICPERNETRSGCFPTNFTCQTSVTFQARIPNCDAADSEEEYCYGSNVNWEWDSGDTFNQAFSIWGEGEADRLTCFTGEHSLNEALNIAIDTVDPTGDETGRLGLWRARSEDEQYGYICEGRLGLVGTQDTSRGTLLIQNSEITGQLVSHLGTLQIDDSTITGIQTHALSRGATLTDNTITGTLNLTSLSRVELLANDFNSVDILGGGVNVTAEFTYAYRNRIDGGAYGASVYGPARFENNIITRADLAGLSLYPEEGPNPTEDTVIISNTLVENNNGIEVSGSVNAPSTMLANNIVYRGDATGIVRIGAAVVNTSHNNVFDYVTLYDNVTPDSNSLSVNPVLVADFPSNPPVLRIDSGSPLIDTGNCALVPSLDFDGAPRPFDGDFDNILGCDIGAYEFGPEEVFIYVDGVLATENSFATGREVNLTLQGIRDGFSFEVNPATWIIDESAGIFDPETGRFRPAATPSFYQNAITAQFGGLNTSLDIDLDCGCIAPDNADQTPGGCNGVPECYFLDWDCPVRENYCVASEVGSFDQPLVVAADETVQVRAGARDIFGFVFRVPGPFSYFVVNGGGTIDGVGRFTANNVSGDFENTLRIDWNGLSGLSNVRVVPATADTISITKTQQTIGTRLTLQYTARILDRFGNEIPDADVVWSLENAQDSVIDPQTGRVTAGCISGIYSNAVVAEFEGVTGRSDLIVEDGGAAIQSIDIIPPSLEISATTTTVFEATVTDACGYTRPAPNPIYTVRATAGEVNPQSGYYEASCNLGAYAGGVTVSSSGLQASAHLTIIDAPLNNVRIQPENAQVRANSSVVFEALGEDTCGRLKEVQPIWTTPIINGETDVADLDRKRTLRLGCSPLSTYPRGMIAVVGPFEASASVEVLAGEVTQLDVVQQNINIPAGGELQLIASAEDACGHDRRDAIRWSASNGQVTEEGVYTAGCVRGQFTNAIFVRAGNEEQGVSVQVEDGVLNSIEIEPSSINIRANETRQMRANLFDGCQNIIEGTAQWSIAEGGQITQGGLLTAGVVARTYFGAVIAELNGFQDQADLIISPAAPQTLTINPSPIRIEAGATQELEVIARDAFGNTFIPSVLWSVDAQAGDIDQENQFTASEIVGDFDDAVIARVDGIEESVNVEIIPGPVDRLNVQPSPVVVQAGETLQMTANPVDRFNNTIAAPVVWAVEGEGGQITQQGFFTADNTAGVYQNSLVARSGEVTSQVTIRVLPNDPVNMRITPEQIILTPNQQLQLLVQVFDTYGNLVESSASYSIENGGASVSPSGLLTAGNVANLYGNTLLVRSGNQEQLLDIQVIPGAPIEIEIEPGQLEIEPRNSRQLQAIFRDAFDNAVDVEHIWSGFGEAGDVTANGLFTASATAGVYPQAVVVRGGGLEAFLNVEVIPGAPVEMHTDPELIITYPGTSVPVTVYFTDLQGNRTDSNLSISWSVVPGSLFSISADGILTIDCPVSPNFYPQELSAVTEGEAFRARADIEVRPGETTFVEITPNRVETQVTGAALLNAEGKDVCGYDTLAVPQWSIIEGQGNINPEGRFTAGTLAETVRVQANINDIQAEAEVVVQPGSATTLNIEPAEISLLVDTRQTFTVEAVDRFDNHWVPNNVVWAVADNNGVFTGGDGPNQEGPVGTITEQGELRTAEATGRFLRSVRATFDNNNAIADVYLLPDVPNTLEVTPNSATLIPRQTISFSTTVRDRFGNEISGLEPTFHCSPEVGICSDSGVLNATDHVGEYPESIEARVENVVGRADVTIQNSEPARIEIDPASLRTTVGSLDLLVATVYDTEGVEIEGATVEWLIDASHPDLGFITLTPQGEARLSVGTVPGRYFSSIIAQIGTVQGTADVIIPTDFDSDGIDDVIELDYGLDPRDPEDALLDPDDDGLTNEQEANAGLSINDGDSDDDGIADGDEPNWNADSDRDGSINALDPDSDDDGLFDGTEIGLTQPHQDTEGTEFFIPDFDPKTTTDPLSSDHDRDGIPDGVEDINHNGRTDPGETSPNQDRNDIICDITLEVTGCPDNLMCIDGICQTPVEEEPPAPDDGCASATTDHAPLFVLIFLGLFIVARRRSHSSY